MSILFIASLTGFKVDIFVSGLNIKCSRFRFLDHLVAAMFAFGDASKCGVPCTEVDFALERNISNQNMHYKRLGGR